MNDFVELIGGPYHGDSLPPHYVHGLYPVAGYLYDVIGLYGFYAGEVRITDGPQVEQ